MICFRDMEFCSDTQRCANTICPRRLTDEVWTEAHRWMGDRATVSTAPRAQHCAEFQPIDAMAPA